MKKKKTIFWVEDIIQDIQKITEILERRNFCVVIAKTYEDALKLSNEKCSYSLVIIDTSLPDREGGDANMLNGYYLFQKIRHRETKINSNVPIIFLTGYREMIPSTDIDNNLTSLISKPVAQSKIIEQIVEKYNTYTCSKIIINIMLLFAKPKETLEISLDREDRIIKQCIERSLLKQGINIDTFHSVTLIDIQRKLLEKQYDIIHIAGHADKVYKELIFADDNGNAVAVSNKVFAELISSNQKKLQCIILNTCFSKAQASNILKKGIPIVIANKNELDDIVALEFTRGFYDSLGSGKDIKYSYKQGCVAAELKGYSRKICPKLYISRI